MRKINLLKFFRAFAEAHHIAAVNDASRLYDANLLNVNADAGYMSINL